MGATAEERAMHIEQCEQGNTTILRLKGDLNEEAVFALRNTMYDCVTERRVNLVLNLSEVRFMSYLGLGVILDRLRQVRKEHGDIKIVGMNMYMDRMFRLGGAHGLFECFETEPQAIEVYRQAA
jgi:anti-anti-sigma factor